MMNRNSPQQRVLNVLQSGARTWNDLKSLTKLSDDMLGYTLGELLDLRKIWTAQRNDVRAYGIERRVGLAPRFSQRQRRATDQA
jgi:hypothetical protein